MRSSTVANTSAGAVAYSTVTRSPAPLERTLFPFSSVNFPHCLADAAVLTYQIRQEQEYVLFSVDMLIDLLYDYLAKASATCDVTVGLGIRHCWRRVGASVAAQSYLETETRTEWRVLTRQRTQNMYKRVLEVHGQAVVCTVLGRV